MKFFKIRQLPVAPPSIYKRPAILNFFRGCLVKKTCRIYELRSYVREEFINFCHERALQYQLSQTFKQN